MSDDGINQSQDDFGGEPTSTPVIDQLPKNTKYRQSKPPRAPKAPRERKALAAGFAPGSIVKYGGLALGLILIAGLAFFAVRALSQNSCDDFSASRTTVSTADGLSVNVLPDALKGAFGVKLSSVAQNDFSVNSGSASVKTAAQAVPDGAKPSSAFYQIQGCNTAPKMATLRVKAPAEAKSLDALAVFGWDETAKRWRWLGAQQDAATRSILAPVSKLPSAVMLMQVAPTQTGISAELAANGQSVDATKLAGLTELNPVGLYLGDNGMVVGDRSLLASVDGNAKVTPVIRNWTSASQINRTLLKDMLASPKAADAHIANIVDLVARIGNYAGAEIDYRGLDAASQDAYAQFLTKLGDALHAKGKTLTVVLPAPVKTNSVDPETMWNTNGYDVRSIAAAADSIKLDMTSDPTLFQASTLDALMNWAISRVGKDKLQAVISAQSVKQAADGTTQFISAAEALQPLGQVVPEQPLSAPLTPGQKVKLKITGLVDPASIQYDADTQTYRYSFADATGATQTVWLNTAASLKKKLDMLAQYNLRGVSVRGLDGAGAGTEAIASAISAMNQATAQTAAPASSLAWSVNGVTDANGKGMTYEWTAPAQAGKYVLGASLTGQNDRGTVNVEVVVPTPTPVPPTATPKPVVVAIVRPTAAPAAVAPAAAATTAPAAVVPPPSSGGWLGVGAHIDTGNNMAGYLARMRSEAGMNWIKVQIVFDSGAPDVSWIVNSAHANGIKVLLGVIGNRSRFADRGYYPTYAAGVAAMAKQGADAIEIWNEPNLDREVGGSNVSPENYTELLRQSYGAIKAANGGTLVIGGAAAPTGYFGGNCTPSGCDDAPFLARARAAGAANYMDCQGAHFNGSPNAPSVTTGGNPGGHPSWYFYGTLDTAYNNMGRPVCFTEMGYVTKDGVMGSLPPGFEWGNGITLAQQAAWEAEVVTRSRQSGKVRLVIVWNANFHKQDGNDPQVAYSIFRPDGSCPACGSIRAAAQ